MSEENELIEEEKVDDSDDMLKRLIEYSKTRDVDLRNTIVIENLGLVKAVANNFSGTTKENYQDLIQEGSIALLKAVENFDLEKNVKFSTFASTYILNSMRAFMEWNNLIRLNSNVNYRLKIIKNAEKNLENKLQRKPTFEEIAKEANLTVEQVQDAQSLPRFARSFDKNLGCDSDDNANNLYKHYADDILPPDEVYDQKIKDKVLQEALAILDEREKDIYLSRNSLLTDSNSTLKKLADKYDISKERVRQIEDNARRKLRKFIEGKLFN